MATETWRTSDVTEAGEAYWLLRLGTTTINWIRANGMPSNGLQAVITIPTLLDQAEVVLPEPELSAVDAKPSAALNFQSTKFDV